MRGNVPEFNLIKAKDLAQALDLISNNYKAFSGGTDLMVQFEAGKLQHKNFVSIYTLPELKKIEVRNDEINIGACVTYDEIQAHPVIQKEFPLLVKSAWVTGAKAIQNRGTLGGNIANMSPAADTPPTLLAYQAKIHLVSKRGSRSLDYSHFHKGYKKADLASDELISHLTLRRQQGFSHHYFRKVGTRSFQAISKTALSVAAQVHNGTIQKINIGLVSVASTPVRANNLENFLMGKNLSQLSLAKVEDNLKKDIAPQNDIRSTSEYRFRVTKNLIADVLEKLGQAPGVYS